MRIILRGYAGCYFFQHFSDIPFSRFNYFCWNLIISFIILLKFTFFLSFEFLLFFYQYFHYNVLVFFNFVKFPGTVVWFISSVFEWISRYYLLKYTFAWLSLFLSSWVKLLTYSYFSCISRSLIYLDYVLDLLLHSVQIYRFLHQSHLTVLFHSVTTYFNSVTSFQNFHLILWFSGLC